MPSCAGLHIAAAMGVARRFVKRWIDRFHGVAGLRDRSSRPHRLPRRTAGDVDAAVLVLRERERQGRDWIAADRSPTCRSHPEPFTRRNRPRRSR